jgi:hypothetical protein
MNRLLHSCSLNLGKGPLVEDEAEDAEKEARKGGDRQTTVSERTTVGGRTAVGGNGSLFQHLYGEDIEKHEAEYAARVAAADEAGLEPPVYEPFDPATAETEAERREKAENEQIEKNRQAAREIWIRRNGTPPPPRGLSWEEREDLRRGGQLQAGNSR